MLLGLCHGVHHFGWSCAISHVLAAQLLQCGVLRLAICCKFTLQEILLGLDAAFVWTYYIVWFRPVQHFLCAHLCACVLLCLWVATSCAC
jgi:hypothetical protein